MRILLSLALFALLLTPHGAGAQSEAKRDLIKWSDEFVQLLNDGKAASAGQMLIDRFQTDWKGTDRVPTPEELSGFVYGFMNRAQPGLGRERIGEGHVGASIFRLSYVIKQEGDVGVVRLWFYRPDSEWKLSEFKFDFVEIVDIEDFL